MKLFYISIGVLYIINICNKYIPNAVCFIVIFFVTFYLDDVIGGGYVVSSAWFSSGCIEYIYI